MMIDAIREYLLKNGYGPVAPEPGPILVVLGEEPPFALRELCMPRIHHDEFVYTPTAAGIALLIDNAQTERAILDLIGMITIPNYKTLAEECLDEIAAEEKQPMECGTGVQHPKCRPAMGLEEFEQALGRSKRGSGSERSSPAEDKEPG